MVPAAPCVCPGVALTCAQAADARCRGGAGRRWHHTGGRGASCGGAWSSSCVACGRVARTRRGDEAAARAPSPPRAACAPGSQPSKSSGRTDSRNWRNSPTNSSGTSSLSSSLSMRQDDAFGLHQLVGHEDRRLGTHRHRHGVGGSARDDRSLLAAPQVQLGVVRRGRAAR